MLAGSKWAYKIKFKSDGSIVADSHQLEGIDFHETFCPNIHPTTIQHVLSIALSNERLIHQFDVENACLLASSLSRYTYVSPRFCSSEFS